MGLSPVAMGLIGLGVMMILMFSGMNLAFAFMIAGFVGTSLMFGPKMALSFFRNVPVATAMSYTFSLLPMFMLMGDFSVKGNLTRDAYDAARKWLGRLPGGLAITSTVASAIFGAICGSGQATAMVMTQVAWPEMERYGYHKGLGLSSIAAAGPLATLIPPSTPMILYAVLSGASIGDLFLAGWGAGIWTTLLLCITIVIIVKRHPEFAPRADKCTLKEKLGSLKGCWEILLLIVLVMYFIWGGVTTVNEAAGVAAICCMIIVLAKRRCKVKDIIEVIKKTSLQAVGLFFMFIGVQVFNNFLVLTRLPAMLSGFIKSLNMPPIIVILIIVVIYVILGCFIDTPVITMLCVPIFAPVVAALGYNLVWFGIISCLCFALGSITPPVGICLFVIGARVEGSMNVMFKWIWPFVIATLIATLSIVFVPQIAMWLPNLAH
jgi:tripartite ATP-independent transporter DctM subunit